MPYYVNGSSGGGATTMAALTDVGAAGLAVGQSATAAEVRAALAAAGLVSESGFTGAEWTFSNGGTGCSAALNGSALRLVVAAGSFTRASGTYTGPCAYRAIGPTDTVDVAIRVSAIGAVSLTQVTLELWEVAGGASGARVAIIAQDTGELYLFRQDTASVIYTGGAGTVTFGGQLWLRLRVVAGIVYIYYGTGVGGALPTSWTHAGTTIWNGVQGRVWRAVAVGAVGAPAGSTQTIDVADLRSISLSAASL